MIKSIVLTPNMHGHLVTWLQTKNSALRSSQTICMGFQAARCMLSIDTYHLRSEHRRGFLSWLKIPWNLKSALH